MSSIVMEEYELLGDSKYRSYMSAVDKALKSFEYTTEWADLISYLEKLIKVVSSHTKFPIVPRRLLIAKRLAQCMHPSLPSGVHHKALATYDVIFKCMGTNRLAQELFLYSAGLFPLMGHAGLGVRSALLAIYEAHFVPLGERLRPALNGLLSGVLPGLEEGSDHCERTTKLLEDICLNTDPPVFYGSLWEVIAANKGVRLQGISYVLQHLDRKLTIKEQRHILGNDLEVMVRGLCLGISDTSVLVQRNALDFLIVAFPFHEETLETHYLLEVVTAAIGVLLRRDMSLNRRLFNWLLGSDVKERLSGPKSYGGNHVRSLSVSSVSSTESASPYFDHYSRDLLIGALQSVFRASLVNEDDSENHVDNRPYRLLTTLLDKPEVGPVIVDDVILDILRTMYHTYYKNEESDEPKKPREEFQLRFLPDNKYKLRGSEERTKRQNDLAKAANLLFSNFHSAYLWDYCGEYLGKATENKYRISDSSSTDVNNIGSEDTTVVEMCAIIDFLLEIVSIGTFVETTSEELPKLFKRITEVISENVGQLTATELTKALKLIRKILAKIEPAFTAWDAQEDMRRSTASSKDVSNEDPRNMWNRIGKEHVQGGGEADRTQSPEIGREATESLPLSPNLDSDGKKDKSQEDVSRERSKSPSVPRQASAHEAYEILMQDCAETFQTLYVKLISHHILPEAFSTENEIRKLIRGPEDTPEERTRLLESLLQMDQASQGHSSDSLNVPILLGEEEATVERLKESELQMRENAKEFVPAVELTCQILIEISSKPTVLSKAKCDWNQESNASLFGCSPKDIPSWLQRLLICCCFLPRKEYANLQLQSIGALLELVSQCVTSVGQRAPRRKKSDVHDSNAGADLGEDHSSHVVIVMMSLIREEHFQCLMRQTVIPQLITSRLWDGLGLLDPVFHSRCVALLHQLHQLVPNASTVERILARSLGSTRGERSISGDVAANSKCVVDAYQRFTLLWHLSRELEGKNGLRIKTFDICTLKMMDNLSLPGGPLKALSQSWLVHAMARGDISRLMEPLFLTLLDPSTARVSVLHANITSEIVCESSDESDNERNIKHNVYIIKTVGKEGIYHVSERYSGGKGDADRAKKLLANNRMRSNLQGSMTDGKSPRNKTHKAQAHPPSTELTSLPLPVNPFALVPPTEENFCYTKGYYQPIVPSDSSSSGSESPQSSMGSATSAASGLSPSVGLNVAKLFGEEEDAPDKSSRSTNDNELDTAGHDETSMSDTLHSGRKVTVHPRHSHLLLYCQVSDSRQNLYCLGLIKNMLETNPRLAICTLSSTSLNSTATSSASSARIHQIQMLLARQRKSVFGKSFGGSLSSENMSTYRNSTLIEVLITTLLYYLRSYYPNLGQARLSEEEIQSNREVQLMSLDILTLLVSELVLVVQDNGKPYADYVADLFSRCKVQKVVLHSLLAGISGFRDAKKEDVELLAFTEDILNFNEINSTTDKSIAGEKISNYSEAYQVQVLRLLLSLVMLEEAISQQRGPDGDKNKIRLEPAPMSTSSSPVSSHHVLRYHADHVLTDQPMFITAIVSALRAERMRHLHSHWTSLVTAILPFLGKSLSQVVVEVSAQLSLNLESLAPFYVATNGKYATLGRIPADYMVTQLEALTLVYHYCLVDSASQVSPSFSSISPILQEGSGTGPGTGGEILNNLLHVFLSNTDTKGLAARSLGQSTSVDTLAIARKYLLTDLPRTINTIAVIWDCVRQAADAKRKSCVLAGSPETVKGQLLDFISPIARHHPVHFLCAVGVAWQERRSVQSPGKPLERVVEAIHTLHLAPFLVGMLRHPLPVSNASQLVLVDLASAVKSMPVSQMITTARQVIKSPPSIKGSKLNVDVSVLQFIYAFLGRSGSKVAECWSSLALLLRDCLNLSAPAVFLALSILNQFILQSPTSTDRREQRELQELTCKLVEQCAHIGGSCLEQSSWLRKQVEVNTDLLMAPEDLDIDLSERGLRHKEPGDASSVASGPSDLENVDSEKSSASALKKKDNPNVQYAVPALSLLGEMLAPILDIIYSSEEKEKVLPLLYNVMSNVTPYLKNHTRSNISSFRACSRLLASLSEYQYTRKSWRKEGMDLLLDPAFFHMDLDSLQQWRIIIDNLMTHDKTTFKELHGKVTSISQSGSLSLFSSKDQELEQRALLLKRLAFVIFCSDIDQFQKQMADIQERLTESLRTIPTSPAVQSAVFLCFRVILVRMSPQHITFIWPLIITEMVQIFSYLEQELSTDSEEWSTHLKRMASLDSSWVMSSAGSNGLVAHNSPAWMGLYLQVCKLLDLALSLPAQDLPQFQMYRWAFVSECSEFQSICQATLDVNGQPDKSPGPEAEQSSNIPGSYTEDFVPYVVRVAKLLLQKIEGPVEPGLLTEGEPQLTMTSITSLKDLGPFFASICQNVSRQQAKRALFGGVSGAKKAQQVIDAIIERDFLEGSF